MSSHFTINSSTEITNNPFALEKKNEVFLLHG